MNVNFIFLYIEALEIKRNDRIAKTTGNDEGLDINITNVNKKIIE